MKKAKVQEVDLSRCKLNEGQVSWLPKNPRQWTKEDINLTMQSIREDEDFLEDRPVLVFSHDKGLLVFAGNLRVTAAKKVGLKTIPAIIYTPETPEDYETIKRRSIKDNGTFGSWDADILANEWDDLNLSDWGVPNWYTGGKGIIVETDGNPAADIIGTADVVTDPGELYMPNLNPVDGVAPVTDKDIAEAAADLADEFNRRQQKLIEVVCPHCGEKFYIKA